MPYGISTARYAGILVAGFGSACVGSLCVHLIMRPDRTPPDMSPYIEAQRDLIRRVQNRKTESEEASTVVSDDGDDKNPLIKTPYGAFRQDELDAKTGLPISAAATNNNIVPRFWTYIPIPHEAVKDLVDGPVVEYTPQPASASAEGNSQLWS